MADIIINIGDIQPEKSTVPVAGVDESQASSTPQKTQENTTTGNKNPLQMGLTAWSKAKPWINQVVSHEVNMVNLRTGRQEYAQKVQFAYGLIQQVEGIGSSIAMGFATGGGPGAIIGAAVGLISTGISYVQKQNQIDTQESLENVNLQQSRIRAGTSGSR